MIQCRKISFCFPHPPKLVCHVCVRPLTHRSWGCGFISVYFSVSFCLCTHRHTQRRRRRNKERRLTSGKRCCFPLSLPLFIIFIHIASTKLLSFCLSCFFFSPFFYIQQTFIFRLCACPIEMRREEILVMFMGYFESRVCISMYACVCVYWLCIAELCPPSPFFSSQVVWKRDKEKKTVANIIIILLVFIVRRSFETWLGRGNFIVPPFWWRTCQLVVIRILSVTKRAQPDADNEMGKDRTFQSVSPLTEAKTTRRCRIKKFISLKDRYIYIYRYTGPFDLGYAERALCWLFNFLHARRKEDGVRDAHYKVIRQLFGRTNEK